MYKREMTGRPCNSSTYADSLLDCTKCTCTSLLSLEKSSTKAEKDGLLYFYDKNIHRGVQERTQTICCVVRVYIL